MAAIHVPREKSLFVSTRTPPPPSDAHVEPAQSHYVLTQGQREILALLEDRPQQQNATGERAASAAGPAGLGLDVAFAGLGVASMAAGAIMVFFFAALGAVLLVAGAIFCAVAFEHVALSDLSAQEAELAATQAATRTLTDL